jgi:phage tail tube protein FII
VVDEEEAVAVGDMAVEIIVEAEGVTEIVTIAIGATATRMTGREEERMTGLTDSKMTAVDETETTRDVAVDVVMIEMIATTTETVSGKEKMGENRFFRLQTLTNFKQSQGGRRHQERDLHDREEGRRGEQRSRAFNQRSQDRSPSR